jgi:hypothetical protein
MAKAGGKGSGTEKAFLAIGARSDKYRSCWRLSGLPLCGVPARIVATGGRKLGTAGSVDTAARARAARSEQTSKANATTRAVIAEIQRKGATTLAAIAAELEARGLRTPAGRSTWAPAQVSRLLTV